MKSKKIYLGLFAGLLFAACAQPQYQLTDDGVILNLRQEKKTDANKLRLQVLGDELIHVSATPDKDFPKDSSLIIVPGLQTVPFHVDDAGDSIMLSTSRLKVMVSKFDGG
jgi:alpha-D-xyloside xylohydrolase